MPTSFSPPQLGYFLRLEGSDRDIVFRDEHSSSAIKRQSYSQLRSASDYQGQLCLSLYLMLHQAFPHQHSLRLLVFDLPNSCTVLSLIQSWWQEKFSSWPVSWSQTSRMAQFLTRKSFLRCPKLLPLSHTMWNNDFSPTTLPRRYHHTQLGLRLVGTVSLALWWDYPCLTWLTLPKHLQLLLFLQEAVGWKFCLASSSAFSIFLPDPFTFFVDVRDSSYLCWNIVHVSVSDPLPSRSLIRPLLCHLTWKHLIFIL